MWRNNKPWRWALLATLAALLLGGGAFAAEVSSGDTYRLAAGQVVEDDLVVIAQEIYIDGTVKGDLVAMGQIVQVSGTVEGDTMILGAEVQITGAVTDDARVAGAGVSISGQIGDDLFATAGGSEGSNYAIPVNGRTIEQGLRVASETNIGGSAYLGAGAASVAGTIKEDLHAAAGTLALAGTIEGSADVSAGALDLSPEAHINGQLRYTSSKEIAVPANTAGDVRFTPPTPTQATGPSLGSQVLRFALIVLGFALVGWLLLRFAPGSVRHPAEAIAAQPGRAGLYGMGTFAILFIIPILSGLVTIALIMLWGWGPGIMFFLFLTAALVLAWTLSPLITGLWLGRIILRAAGREASDIVALLAGAALIVLLGFLPFIGWLFSLASLILAIGGVLLYRQGSYDSPAAAATPTAWTIS